MRLQPTIKFVDDCVLPNVTPVFNEPGHLIVIRVVEVQVGRGTVQRKTYSSLMDGQSIDAWKMIQVQSAPNKLAVVISPHALEPHSSKASVCLPEICAHRAAFLQAYS